MFKKTINIVIAVLSALVLIFDIIDIIDIKNITIMRLLYGLLVIEIPINIYFLLSFIVGKKKNIIIDNINMIAVNHEFDNYKDLLRQTKHLEIQSVNYTYEFKGTSFTSIRTYKGKCISPHKEISRFPLVVAGDKNATFNQIDCYAYNLIEDKEKKYKLRPNLMTNEGLYKFASYNFHNPLKYNQEFSIETHYTWPDCVSQKKDYILASPIFNKKSFDKFNTELRFYDIDRVPIRIKKYVINKYKSVTPLGELPRDIPQKNSRNYISFSDIDIEMSDNIAFFVYIYDFED